MIYYPVRQLVVRYYKGCTDSQALLQIFVSEKKSVCIGVLAGEDWVLCSSDV